MKTLTTENQSDTTRQATDTEMLDWLSERCFFPNDHPEDDLIVIVPERFAAHGAFTMNAENDKAEFRNAVRKAMPHT
jgi:hypothetical protein